MTSNRQLSEFLQHLGSDISLQESLVDVGDICTVIDIARSKGFDIDLPDPFKDQLHVLDGSLEGVTTTSSKILCGTFVAKCRQ